MSGALVGDDAAGLERLAGYPFRPRRSALFATRAGNLSASINVPTSLRADDTETRPHRRGMFCSFATGTLKIEHCMPIARDKLIIDLAIGTVCARGAPEHQCTREAPASCAVHAVAASSLRIAANNVPKKPQ